MLKMFFSILILTANGKVTICFYHRYLGEVDCSIDIECLLNRLLKACYVPVTSACLAQLFYYFFAVAINSTNKANKAGGHDVKQSTLLRCLWTTQSILVCKKYTSTKQER